MCIVLLLTPGCIAGVLQLEFRSWNMQLTTTEFSLYRNTAATIKMHTGAHWSSILDHIDQNYYIAIKILYALWRCHDTTEPIL